MPDFAHGVTRPATAQPSGEMGAEIWVTIVDPAPPHPGQLSFLSVDTPTPYTADVPGEDAGQTAHYMLRWVTTTGEKGPWGETPTATIEAYLIDIV